MESILREAQKAVLLAWPRRYQGMAVALLVFLFFVGFARFSREEFQSDARVYLQANAVIKPLLSGLAIHYDDVGQIDVLEKTILSEENIAKILKSVRFPGDETQEGHVANIELIRKNAKISEISKDFFDISFRDKSPLRAQKVVEAMIATLSDDIMGRDSADMEAANTFIDQQIHAYEEKLRAAERRRADFRTLFMDVLPDDFNGGLSHLDLVRQQITELKTEIADEKAKREVLEKDLEAMPEYVPAETIPAQMMYAGGIAFDMHDPNPALTEARLRLEQLQTRFTDDYPEVIAQKGLISILKDSPVAPAMPRAIAGGAGGAGQAGASQKAGQGKQVKNPEYILLSDKIIDTDTALATENRHLSEEVSQEAGLSARLQKEPMVQAEYDNLNRDYNIVKDNYEHLLDRREQLHISMAIGSGAEKDRLKIVQKPLLPKHPVFPLKILSLVVSLPIAVLAGAGFALLVGYLNRGFLYAAELREFDIYILGDISAAPLSWSAIAMKISVPVVFVFVLAGAEAALFLFFRSHFA